MDAAHYWVSNENGKPIFKLLALTGDRVWVVSLDARSGYKASSFVKGDISGLELGFKRDGELITLRIDAPETSEEFSGTGPDAERLTSLHRLLAT